MNRFATLRFALAAPISLSSRSVVTAQEAVIRVETPMAPPRGPCSSASCSGPTRGPARSSSTATSTTAATSNASSAGAATTGPDDAIENVNDWPVLHALGAPESILPPVQEGLGGPPPPVHRGPDDRRAVRPRRDVLQGIPRHVRLAAQRRGADGLQPPGAVATPATSRFRQRVTRFAGFYLNEDPGAPELRPEAQDHPQPVQRQPRPAAPQGDGPRLGRRPDRGRGPVPARPRRAQLREMLEHFKDYNDIVGDHPQNLAATSLALNAYMLTHEPKYKTWLLEYVDAWRQRMIDNGGIIPTNIGLDGKIGGAAGGKWYGGVYGWGFTVIDPVTGEPVHRNQHHLGPQRLRQRLPPHRRRPLPRRLAEADRRGQRPEEGRSTAGRSTRTCTATRAGTTTRRSRTSTGRSSSTTGR